MDFAKNLANRLQEEKEAVLKYQELAALAPDEVTRRVMLRISRDAERHADFLTWILEENIKKTPSAPMSNEVRPKSLRPKSRVRNKKYKYL